MAYFPYDVWFLLCMCVVSLYGQGDNEEYYDPFETDSRDWRLAFRGTRGIDNSLWDAYRYTETVPVEPGCKQFEPNQPCTHHYRNNAVFSDWKNINQVALVLYANGSRVADVIFDGKSTDVNSWFTQQKIVSSPWTDIKTSRSNVYFSIVGHHDVDRRFFMEHTYGGCPGDVGWFIAIDAPKLATTTRACDWERKFAPTFPQFLYAKKNIAVNWNTPDVGVADVMAIFVKYSTSGQVIGK